MTIFTPLAAAQALADARAQRTPLTGVVERFALKNLDDAIQVQHCGFDLARQAGQHSCGAKAGLTSPAMQAALGLKEPLAGLLFAELRCPPDSEVSKQRLLQPRIEAEIALLIGRDLPAHEPSLEEFLACLEGAVPALEINDTAIDGWKLGLLDSVADNLCAGLYMTGASPVTLARLQDMSLVAQLTRNGEAVFSDVRADLQAAVQVGLWLAQRMARLGQPLKQGEVLLCGALAPMGEVKPGDRFELHIEGLGQLTCSFASE